LTADLNPSLKSIKEAISAGQIKRARELLQQVARSHPEDVRVWLWLASLSTTRQESLDYIAQAERIAPNDNRVRKAQAWAMNHFVSETKVEETTIAVQKIEVKAQPVLVGPSSAPAKKPGDSDRVFRYAALLLLISLLVVTSGLVYAFLSRDSNGGQGESQGSIRAGAVTAVIASTKFNPQDKQTQAPTSEPTPTTLPTSTAEPTTVVAVEEAAEQQTELASERPAEVPQRADMIQPKNISSSKSEPLPTWTPTPRPTETPTPSPTPYPTFVSGPSEATSDRPYGLSIGEKWIDVNISSQSLIAYEGEIPVFDSLVSTGTNQHPTVTGQFRIWLRFQSQDMDGYRLGYDYFLRNVPYVQYFYYDYSLHGTFWHSNFGNQMSHGCVNLPTPAAEWLYNWAEYGTLVNIHY